jgi:DNA invertase Pin-like site-specific DNA recombinase
MAETHVIDVWGPGIGHTPDDVKTPSENGYGVNKYVWTFVDTYFTIRLLAKSSFQRWGITVKIVAYYRVSTKKQGESGLGLEAQQEAVRAFASEKNGTIIRHYTEIETGKSAERPELQKALAHAKRTKATLVIAKLDRLARNVHFTSGLMESGVDFIACDIPYANRLTIHILAAVAEDEARRISERTKAALAAAKRRGMKLGSARPGHWNGKEGRRLAGLQIGRRKSIESKRRAAREAYADLMPQISKWRNSGLSLREIAHRLDAEGYTTRRGKAWNPVQVGKILSLESIAK